MKYQDRKFCDRCDKVTFHLYSERQWGCQLCLGRGEVADGLADLAKLIIGLKEKKVEAALHYPHQGAVSVRDSQDSPCRPIFIEGNSPLKESGIGGQDSA